MAVIFTKKHGGTEKNTSVFSFLLLKLLDIESILQYACNEEVLALLIGSCRKQVNL